MSFLTQNTEIVGYCPFAIDDPILVRDDPANAVKLKR